MRSSLEHFKNKYTNYDRYFTIFIQMCTLLTWHELLNAKQSEAIKCFRRIHSLCTVKNCKLKFASWSPQINVYYEIVIIRIFIM